ncbi:MAG: D-inositol-3-phosphate glycosyltransferase [Fimbriimonadaceae bacterium]|nr:D-inositol-3-phosphate glycosyltransferase [Fimbriimonadaceae bacterium]
MTNMIAPYRIPVYENIAAEFDTTILYSGQESNRSKWDGILAQLKNARARQAWGLTFKRRKRAERELEAQGIFDYQFIHITPGYLVDLARIRPRAIIANEMGFRALAALFYGTVARVPVWIWWGGTLHTERSVGRLRKIVRGIVKRWAKRWISYGQTSTDYLESIGVNRDRILQIQNCVDETRYSDTVEPSENWTPKPVVLHVGQLIARKGIMPMLTAAVEVQRNGAEFSLVLVGDGPDRALLEQQVKDLGLKNVVFAGARKPSDMPAVYRSADCLVFPTLEDVWGLVANEAILCGLPVVASKFAGCSPELFDAEQVFDPTDPVDFARVFKLIVEGKVPPADRSKLKTTAEVAEMIVTDVRRAMGQ